MKPFLKFRTNMFLDSPPPLLTHLLIFSTQQAFFFFFHTQIDSIAGNIEKKII